VRPHARRPPLARPRRSQREDIQSKPRGDRPRSTGSSPHQPGFVYDALGQIYVRGNHGQHPSTSWTALPLPDTGLRASSGQFLTARCWRTMEVITGGLPGTEYGQRLSAGGQPQSRRPAPEGEGRFDLLYGSYNTVSPGGYWGDRRSGRSSYLVRWKPELDGPGARDPPTPTDLSETDKAAAGAGVRQGGPGPDDRDHLSHAAQLLARPLPDPASTRRSSPGNTQPDEFGNPPRPTFRPDTSADRDENDVFGILSYPARFRRLALAAASPATSRHSAAKFFGDSRAPPRFHPRSASTTTRDSCPGVSNVNRRARPRRPVSRLTSSAWGDQHTAEVRAHR
jgi:hypothetical protein